MKSITITEESLNIKQFLSSGNYIQVNKSLIKKVGIEAAYFLTYLIEKESQFKKGLVERDDKNWFFAESKKIENDTCLSYRNQKTAISVLESNGLLVTKLMGIPRKLYFSIRSLNIFHFVNCINSETITTYESEEQIHINKDSLEERLKEGSEPVQLPHPNLVPNNLESDGTEIPSEPLVVENHSKSERGGYSKSVQASKAPQPPDVKKYASDFSQLLRKKFPKDEMYKFLDEVSLDIPTISEMFVEYWIYQRSREFLIRNENNLFSGFREWIKIAKTKEIPAKETTSGIHAKPIMEKVLHEVGKKKRMTLSPTDAGKVNKFIAESGVSDKALEHGTKNFCSGSGNTWDQWIFVVGNAIKAEKLGEI